MHVFHYCFYYLVVSLFIRILLLSFLLLTPQDLFDGSKYNRRLTNTIYNNISAEVNINNV